MKNPGKLFSNNALPGFFLLLFCFSIFTSILNAKTMVMVSRLDFVPSMLEMVKLSLEKSLKCPVSLTFQPVLSPKPIFVRRRPDYLLVEKGFPDKSLPVGYEQVVNAEISLVWVLGLNSLASKYLENNSVKDLKEFAQLLVRVKKSKPAMFPWFEAIFSKNTFYNLNSVLGENVQSIKPIENVQDVKKTKDTSDIDSDALINISGNNEFWKCKGAIQILHQAMAEELLNPLSLESDELLAFDVFRSGDCIATSFWVPIEYIIDPKKAVSYLGEVMLLPFPTMEGKGIVPKVTLNLWQKKDDSLKLDVANYCLAQTNEFTLLECHFQSYLNWMRDKFIERYDQLVVGDLD